MSSSSASAPSLHERIVVQISPGETQSLIVPISDTVWSVAMQIHEQFGVAPSVQQWVVKQWQFLDDAAGITQEQKLEQQLLQLEQERDSLQQAGHLLKLKIELMKARLTQPAQPKSEQDERGLQPKKRPRTE